MVLTTFYKKFQPIRMLNCTLHICCSTSTLVKHWISPLSTCNVTVMMMKTTRSKHKDKGNRSDVKELLLLSPVPLSLPYSLFSRCRDSDPETVGKSSSQLRLLRRHAVNVPSSLYHLWDHTYMTSALGGGSPKSRRKEQN